MSDFFYFKGLLLVEPVLVELVLDVRDALADAGLEDLLGFLVVEEGLDLLALLDYGFLELVFILGV